MRRVVVTGLGLVTPLGGDVETSWGNILASKSGAGKITRFDASDQKCHIACEVKPADHEYGFDPICVSTTRSSVRLILSLFMALMQRDRHWKMRALPS